MLSVEVFYASLQQQKLIACEVREGATVEEAILQSGILNDFPEINLSQNKVGIFGKVVSLSRVLVDGDRVEIYRPLIVDPKQARKLKVIENKKQHLL